MNAVRIAATLALSLGSALAAIPIANAADAPSAPALAAPPKATEAEIPFARKNVWNWQADGEQGIWVQALDHQWYYGKFMTPCIDLPFRIGVGFRYGPQGELDKWGAVIVPHFPECIFTSFTHSDGPPNSKKRKPSAVAPATPAPSSAPSAASGAAT
jgi:hypothetical protein